MCSLGVLAPLALLPALASVVVGAQETYPIFTADHLVSTMTTLGPNVAATRASFEDGDVASAKARLLRSREQLATTITFWRDFEDDQAIGFLRDAVSRMDAFDDALSSDPVDMVAAGSLLGEIDSACQSCHVVYREQDPATGQYRVKPKP